MPAAAEEIAAAHEAARAEIEAEREYRLEWKPLSCDDDPEECVRASFWPSSDPDTDPVAKVLAREQLAGVLARTGDLSELGRRALALAASDWTHREIADTLHLRVRGVNNAP